VFQQRFKCAGRHFSGLGVSAFVALKLSVNFLRQIFNIIALLLPVHIEDTSTWLSAELNSETAEVPPGTLKPLL
jgi:hypothetical protein